MPALDLPLAELKRYAGRNPKPADFDAYWTAALAELQATDPQPELRPAAFHHPAAECFDLWFTGLGGARVYAKYLRPRGGERAPAVLQFHGYTGHSGDWFEKLAWPAAGVACAAMDVRGQGGRSEDLVTVKGTTWRGHIIRGLDDPDPTKLAYRQIFLDTVQLARVVADFAEVDPERLGCWGASQGGALALACAALEPRVRRCAAVHPFLCDFQRVWEMDLGREAYAELTYFFRVADPRHEREAEIFGKLGYIDCQHLAPRIRASVLGFTGLVDPTCPPSSQFAAFNRITAPKEIVVYPDYAHEAMPGVMDRISVFLRGL